MALQFPQFSSPFTTIFTVCTQHMKLCHGALQALISKQFEVVLPAYRTGFMFSFKTVTTCAAEVSSTTFRLVWVSKYQAAYWTFHLKSTRRWFNKLAIVSTKCLLLWPAMRLCPSDSSLWCVGVWSFPLLSKCYLLCVYIQSQKNKLHHNSYQIVAVMHVCVKYYNTMYRAPPPL